MPITMKRAMEIVLGLAEQNVLDGDADDDVQLEQMQNQQGSIDKVSRVLGTIDEFCQMGLNSSDPKHWDAALQDIMQYVRE